jgi:hypothetical protein
MMFTTSNHQILQFLRAGFYLLSITGIQACGGGGGGGGDFLAASAFAQQCANPRNGIDPFTNQPY